MALSEPPRRFVIRCLRDDHLHKAGNPAAVELTAVTDELEVGPLFHSWLRQQGSEADWPEDVLEHWRSQAQREATVETIRARELEDLVAAAASAGVEALLYKGAALRYLAYDSPHVRPSADTDLLIRPADLVRFSSIIQQAGYVAEPSDRGLGGHHEKVFSKRGPLNVMLTLDVHWSLNNYPAIGRALPIEDLFKEAVAVEPLGKAARAVCRRHSLIMSGLHYCVHRPRDRRFLWLYDTKRLLAQVDENELRELVMGLPDPDVRRLFCDSIELVCSSFDLERPAWIADVGAEQGSRESYYLRDNRTPRSDFVQRVREFPTWSERFGYLTAFLIPSPWFIRQNFGARSGLGLATGYLRFWSQEIRNKLLRS